MEIIIVGAGIAGLALAGLLGRSGHKVTVLEAAPAISEVGAGLTCSPNLTRLLSRWGHDAEIRKHIDVLSQISLRRWEKGEFLGAAPLMPRVEELHGAPQYVAHRADIHKVLLEDAATVSELRVNSMVTAVDFFAPSVTLSDGITLRADLIVGADDKATPTGDAAYRACIPLDEINDPELREFVTERVATRWMGGGRHVQAYPIRHGQLYNMVLCHPDTDISEESWTAKASKQRVLENFADWDTGRLQKLLDLIPEDNVLEWRLCQHDPLPTWILGKLVLLGDACHPMLPYNAQGAAQAVEDVAVLHLAIDRVKKPSDLPALLKAYELARKSRSEFIMLQSGVTGKALHLHDGPEQQARDQKFGSVSQGGDNPDLLGDAATQTFLWDHDPEQHFLDNIEALLQSAHSQLTSNHVVERPNGKL
ncbi:hypothetical protein H2204_001097 [Knufia peltigerae]|uniref:FAD-binding domain-containing protein n=1 Tax=Knufia peltigerae TaxID=1002370 RepID=A0AA38YDM1_9EURO|nr:hypothetical protein H2204_001097 [Knufia peltigerae]